MEKVGQIYITLTKFDKYKKKSYLRNQVVSTRTYKEVIKSNKLL